MESGRQFDKTGKERDRREDQGVTGAHQEKVPGAVKVEVIINELDSSNRDVALISEFTDTEALAAYQVHPDHLAAKEYIGSVAGNRACLDYEY